MGRVLKYLHQNKEASKEEQCRPLHPVQNDLKILHVSQNQKPQRPQDGDPTWERTTHISRRRQECSTMTRGHTIGT